jgi:menaquinone-dependent protoporphyrinogen oxidase
MTVHVITASKHESTREVGEAIAQRLRDRGHSAVAEAAEGLGELASGEPVALGSPIYMGRWRNEARAVVARLADEPPGRPIWLFTLGPLGDPPKPDDAGPEEEVERFAAERAIDHTLFNGKLDRSLLNRRERLAVRAVKAPEGDFRDWPAIGAWADQISDALFERAAQRGEAEAHVAG